jgi:hypothetical protein
MRALPLLALVALLVAGPATASPIQYDFTSGFVTLTATVGGIDISAPVTAALDGIQVTIDEDVPELVSLELTSAGPIDLVLASDYLGYGAITIESLAMSGSSGLLVAVDPGPPVEYFFLVDPLLVELVVSAAGMPALVSVPVSDETAGSGSLFVAADLNELTLSGITIGAFNPLGAGTPPIVLKADFAFSGSVIPEPGAALLFAAGFAAVAARRKRDRNRMTI